MLHNAYAVTKDAVHKGAPRLALDSATTEHHDAHSLQAARPIIAILGTASDAVPFANYLPADIKSNEARLAIVSSYAGKEYGGYKVNDNMDGENSGRLYAHSGRVHIAPPMAVVHLRVALPQFKKHRLHAYNRLPLLI